MVRWELDKRMSTTVEMPGIEKARDSEKKRAKRTKRTQRANEIDDEERLD